MSRLKLNFQAGTITDNPLAIGATTINSAEFASIPAIAASPNADILAIVLDPDAVNGAPEIVWITSHTASATSAPVLRGQEGTTARQHPQGTKWVHAVFASFDLSDNFATRTYNRASFR